MFCILPSTRLAMEGWPQLQIPDASALFNLMRNLGGAIGIALVDTVVGQRTAGHANHLIARLQAGDPDAARAVGLPTEYFHNQPMGTASESIKEMVAPMIQRAAMTLSFNEAWLLLGALFFLSFAALWLLRPGAFTAEAYSARNK